MNNLYKNYVFTKLRPTENIYLFIENLHLLYKIEYLIMGFEVGETSNIPHLQCYIEFKTPVHLFKMKQLHFKECYFQPATATRSQNIAYCTKQNLGVYELQDGKFARNTLPRLDKESISQYLIYNRPARLNEAKPSIPTVQVPSTSLWPSYDC